MGRPASATQISSPLFRSRAWELAVNGRQQHKVLDGPVLQRARTGPCGQAAGAGRCTRRRWCSNSSLETAGAEDVARARSLRPAKAVCESRFDPAPKRSGLGRGASGFVGEGGVSVHGFAGGAPVRVQRRVLQLSIRRRHRWQDMAKERRRCVSRSWLDRQRQHWRRAMVEREPSRRPRRRGGGISPGAE